MPSHLDSHESREPNSELRVRRCYFQSPLQSEQRERSVKKGNELVKVAVNVISPLADPRAAALLLQAITWPRTRAACLSSLLPCLAFTDRGKKRGEEKKV